MLLHLTPMDAIAEQDVRAASKVFFDGGCPVCRREIAWYTDRPGGKSMSWIDVTDDANASEFPTGYDRDALLRRFTVVRRDGVAVTGAAGFVAIWRAIDSLAWIGRLLDRRPIVWAGQHFYALFLFVRQAWRKA